MEQRNLNDNLINTITSPPPHPPPQTRQSSTSTYKGQSSTFNELWYYLGFIEASYPIKTNPLILDKTLLAPALCRTLSNIPQANEAIQLRLVRHGLKTISFGISQDNVSEEGGFGAITAIIIIG